MPQWRKLWVKVLDSEDVNDMPDDFTRLMWLLMPLILDSEGRGKDIPTGVKSKIFPSRTDVTVEQVATAMNWYAAHGMIVRYQVDGRRYFWVPTFHKYQGDTSREAKSTLPEPPPLEPVQTPTKPQHDQYNEDSRPTHDLLLSKSCSDADADAEEIQIQPPPAAVAPTAQAGGSRAAKVEPTPLSTAGQEFFRQFKRKRWSTPAQRDAFEQAERDVGETDMLAAIEWAATKNIADVGAIVKAARKIHSNGTGSNGNGNTQPRTVGNRVPISPFEE